MGLYNVVQPCFVGDKHYTRPTDKPIPVPDEVAAPLVEAGALEGESRIERQERVAVEMVAEEEAADPGTFTLADPEADTPVRGPRRSRRRNED